LKNLCPSKDLVVKNDKKKPSNKLELKRVYLLNYNQTRISFFIDVFYLIIKIYESFKPIDLQNNHLVLNMWLGSSQNLKLQINNNGSRSSFSPNHHKSVGVVVGMANPLHVYGHWIFWTPITRKYGSTLGASFLT